jgi:hypothetical protein
MMTMGMLSVLGIGQATIKYSLSKALGKEETGSNDGWIKREYQQQW